MTLCDELDGLGLHTSGSNPVQQPSVARSLCRLIRRSDHTAGRDVSQAIGEHERGWIECLPLSRWPWATDFARELELGLQGYTAPEWATRAQADAENLSAGSTVRFRTRLSLAEGRHLVADLYWPWFLDGSLTELPSCAVSARSLRRSGSDFPRRVHTDAGGGPE